MNRLHSPQETYLTRLSFEPAPNLAAPMRSAGMDVAARTDFDIRSSVIPMPDSHVVQQGGLQEAVYEMLPKEWRTLEGQESEGPRVTSVTQLGEVFDEKNALERVLFELALDEESTSKLESVLHNPAMNSLRLAVLRSRVAKRLRVPEDSYEERLEEKLDGLNKLLARKALRLQPNPRVDFAGFRRLPRQQGERTASPIRR